MVGNQLQTLEDEKCDDCPRCLSRVVPKVSPYPVSELFIPVKAQLYQFVHRDRMTVYVSDVIADLGQGCDWVDIGIREDGQRSGKAEFKMKVESTREELGLVDCTADQSIQSILYKKVAFEDQELDDSII